MDLFTPEQRATLLANGAKSRRTDDLDPLPVVKLFTPWSSGTWLLTELDPSNPDLAWGLCDLGLDSPELGTVPISELLQLRGPGGLGVERDIHFTPQHPISWYAARASESGRIVY